MTNRHHTTLTIFKVLRGTELLGFSSTEEEAREIAAKWNDSGVRGAEQATVTEERIEVNVSHGEVKGSFAERETVHVIFQFDCGKWCSEDLPYPKPGPLLAQCGCRTCGDLITAVYYDSSSAEG